MLNRRLDAHSNRIETLEETVETLFDELEEERESRKAAERRAEELEDDLRNDISELDARTDMLQLVGNSDEMGPEQRTIALIQNLRQDALRKREKGRSAKASMSRVQAERALHFPDLDRTTFYTDMKRAARWVDNKNVLWYEPGELRLNLEAGDLPDAIRGHALNGGR